MKPFACRNCRRPLHWSEVTGWLHGELPQYADRPLTCERPIPVCMYGNCDHAAGPDPACSCGCHISGGRPPAMDRAALDAASCQATFREEPMRETVYCEETERGHGTGSRHTGHDSSGNYYAWLDGDEGAGWDPDL